MEEVSKMFWVEFEILKVVLKDSKYTVLEWNSQKLSKFLLTAAFSSSLIHHAFIFPWKFFTIIYIFTFFFLSQFFSSCCCFQIQQNIDSIQYYVPYKIVYTNTKTIGNRNTRGKKRFLYVSFFYPLFISSLGQEQKKREKMAILHSIQKIKISFYLFDKYFLHFLFFLFVVNNEQKKYFVLLKFTIWNKIFSCPFSNPLKTINIY